MLTYPKKITAVCLAFCLALGAPLALFAEEIEQTETEETEETAPYAYALPALGQVQTAAVTHLGAATTLTRFSGQNGSVLQTLYCVESDPQKGGRLLPVNLGDGIAARGYVSGTTLPETEELSLKAAVNADFFSFATGVPMGVFVRDGRFVSSSDGRDAVGFDQDGGAFMGKVGERLRIEVTKIAAPAETDEPAETAEAAEAAESVEPVEPVEPVEVTETTDDGETTDAEKIELPVAYLNKYPSVYGVYLLTGDYAATTGISETLPETEYILELEGDLRLGQKTAARVREIRKETVNGEIPTGCAVLCVPQALAGADAYAVLTAGTRLEIAVDCESEFLRAESALGGGDLLLDRGVLVEGLADEDHEKSRQPRTAVGIKDDGKLMLFVLDGRQSHSAGLKIYDLCETARALGCTSLLNLDGGGSSALVTFGEKTVVQNKPSDGSQRKVTNSLAACENGQAALEYILTCAPLDKLLLTGATVALPLTLTDAAGAPVEIGFDAENTTVLCEGGPENIAFVDGGIAVTAGNAQGVVKLHISTEYDGHTAETDVYLCVTQTIDSLAFDEALILSDAAAPHTVELVALYQGKKVYYGDLCELRSEDPRIALTTDGGFVTLTPTADGEERAPLSGRIGASLCGKVAVASAYFDDALALDLASVFTDLHLDSEDYALTFDETGGVTGEGAYLLTVKEEEPEEEPTPETEQTPETEPAPDDAPAAEPLPVTDAPTDDTPAAETAPTDEGPASESEPEPTPEPEPEPEPTPEPAPDIPLVLSATAPKSRGYAGRRLWLWVDGLAPSAEPYATFTVTGTDGKTSQLELSYHRYYDFTDFNGRALLVLDLDFEEGALIEPKDLLCFAVPQARRTVSVGPVYLAGEYGASRYTDLVGHWSSYYVSALTYMEILSGSEDLHGKLVFRPDDPLTREQFAKVLVAYCKLDTADYADIPLDFDDTGDISPWAVPYVRAAVGAGLMRGRATVRDTVEFAPRAEITRQEAIYVLGGQLGDAYDTADRPLFTDDELIAPFARQNLLRAAEAGLLSGYEDGSIRPRGNITRAEAATLVLRLYNVLYGHTVVS